MYYFNNLKFLRIVKNIHTSLEKPNDFIYKISNVAILYCLPFFIFPLFPVLSFDWILSMTSHAITCTHCKPIGFVHVKLWLIPLWQPISLGKSYLILGLLFFNGIILLNVDAFRNIDVITCARSNGIVKWILWNSISSRKYYHLLLNFSRHFMLSHLRIILSFE